MQTLIYEVNLEVLPTLLPDFTSWLKDHIQQILKIDGFETAEAYKVDDSPCSLVVQYRVKDRVSLEAYLNNQAQKMRQEAVDKFADGFTAKRRILEVKPL